MGSKLSEIWSGLFIPDPDPDYLPILDSGSRGQKGTGFRIRIRNTARLHFLSVLGTVLKRGAKLLQMLHSFSSILSFLLKHTFMKGGWGLRKQFRHCGTSTYQRCLRSRLTVSGYGCWHFSESRSGPDPGFIELGSIRIWMHICTPRLS